jgi:hypothetical protein
MQIITGYSVDHSLSNIFKFRLFHLNHPRLKYWRSCQHNKIYHPDAVEQLVIDTVPSKQLVTVDCAGWTMSEFDFKVQCFESDPIACYYYPKCHVEPDLFTHRPTYTQECAVLVRYPWFLKYSKIPDLVNFLELWTTSSMILNFYEQFVQHNYLKYQLIDLVQECTALNIQKITTDLWLIEK